jgi:tetratricopeptide (TPR) repeat protein
MGHSYDSQDLESALRRTAPGPVPEPDFAAWQKKHAEIVADLKSRPGAKTNRDRSFRSVLRFGSVIMRTRKRRFGIAVAAAVALAVVLIVPGTDKVAWSMEQTIDAMKKVEAVHITGKTICRGKRVDFECWVRTPPEGSDLLRLRYQCGCERNTTVVVQGKTVYWYEPAEKAVNVLDGTQMMALQYWYEAAKISPWPMAKLLENLQLVGRDWQQTTEKDPNTGRERIVVTCNHPLSQRSARFVVDPKSKLVRQARMWSNLQRQGEPEYDVQKIVYNPEIPDDFFTFQAPPSVAVFTQEDHARYQQANRLFDEKKYDEAIALYRKLHERWPGIGKAQAPASRMIGLCYESLGQRDQAIAALQRALQEYPEGWIGLFQYDLGRLYFDNGQPQEALKMFESCLAAADSKRDPNGRILKGAREYIARIKGQ